MEKLGVRQQQCLQGLKDFGLWKTGYCCWTYSTPKETQDIMESLVRRKLVVRSIIDGDYVYKLPNSGKLLINT